MTFPNFFDLSQTSMLAVLLVDNLMKISERKKNDSNTLKKYNFTDYLNFVLDSRKKCFLLSLYSNLVK